MRLNKVITFPLTGKYYWDLWFAPRWLTRKILDDWYDVSSFEVTSIEEWSVKSYIVNWKITYNINEEPIVVNAYFYLPKRQLKGVL